MAHDERSDADEGPLVWRAFTADELADLLAVLEASALLPAVRYWPLHTYIAEALIEARRYQPEGTDG